MNYGIEESRHEPSDAMHNTSQPFKFLLKDTCLICHGDTQNSIEFLTPMTMEILPEPTSNKLCGDSSKLNLPDHRWRWIYLIPAKSDSLPHAHAQTTKTYYKHQDSRIKKSQELKTKTSANSDIQDLPSKISSLSREIVSKLSR
ncbi:hypothetical protein Tco_0980332 [Tanacetum coccineum]